MARRATAPTPPPTTQLKFVEMIPPNMGVDFIRLAVPMLIASWVVIGIGLVSIWLRGGLNYGIDFVGGTSVQVKFVQETSISDIRAALERPDLREVVVQEAGGARQEFQIRVLGAEGSAEDAAAASVKAGLQGKFGEGSFEVLRTETVGPKVGKDLWRNAMLAVFAS